MMPEKRIAVFIWFIGAFFIIIFPLVAIAGDFYPFSRYQMFARSRLPACGYVISTENNKPLYLASFEKALEFSRYIAKHIRKQESKTVLCQGIQRQFLPKYDKFSVQYFCLNGQNVKSPEPSYTLNCQ